MNWKSVRHLSYAALLALSPLLGCAAHDDTPNAPGALTVCAIDTPDHACAGREVTIEGAWVGGIEHGYRIIDPSCHPYGLPYNMIPIEWPSQYSADSGIAEFEHDLSFKGAMEHIVARDEEKCICSGRIEYTSSGLLVFNLEKAQLLVSRDGRHYEPELFWKDTTGAGRSYALALVDEDACFRAVQLPANIKKITDMPLAEGLRQVHTCMKTRGWKKIMG